MEDFKIVYVKFDDDKKLLENLKSMMKAYEMQLIKVDGDRYIFDRDGAYSREFIIYKAFNGWTVIHDEDDVQAESMCQELSELSHCFILCIGVYNEELLFYTAFNDGGQVDQYMSDMEYYEYQLNEDSINTYKGNAQAFSDVIGDDIVKLQHILDECRNKEMKAEEVYLKIQQILGVVEIQNIETEDMDDSDTIEQEEEEVVEIGEIFYVDFNSISIKTDSRQKVIDAVRMIADESGYVEVESFDGVSEEKKGFFKKILSSVTESRRIRFYISPLSEGWVTLVGEVEILYGEETSQWEFLHIEDRLSQILGNEVINVFGDIESWGFKVYKDGSLVYGYSSDDEFDGIDETLELFDGSAMESLNNVLDKQVQSPEEIDSIMDRFCGLLKIRNYKINIPMDYSDEEYKLRILNKLPDGKEFVLLRCIKKR